MWEQYSRTLPLVAVLQGLTQQQAVPVGEALYDAGLRIIEVPLDAPDALQSIVLLDRALGERCLIGAAGVIRLQQIRDVAHAGGRLIASPHGDTRLVQASKAAGLVSAPGVTTLTEAFAALNAGADSLALLPAQQLSPTVLQAWRAMLPADVSLLPTGGITPDNMAEWRTAGASGFGLNAALYRPGMSVEEVKASAERFVGAWREGS
ncbi:2-dehydro-3-deoxy-6-phosphogalactonate aldolase [Kushneria aurantia]|uniref:2-dehydro-3-deoxy-6-phosphogalactonate aldolase n=1 Tax=Kushneria aurantia TaxID=504092 RepID=A0ABV6G3F1_9GAMM|nr:2-dehydro-3-deoxy-6-phosphogalactonate aldolase [Kushneria aurantia]